jgi:GTP-binding protein
MMALGDFMAEQNKAHPAQGQERPAADAAADDPEKRALAWAHTARFRTTASQLDQLPPTELPEIAFAGRTQHINLFDLGPKTEPNALFADLPGYGYAAVARGAKLRWQKVMADYLDVRRSLTGVVLMIDSRLGFTDLDRQLMSFVAPRVGNGSVRLLVLLTKADKLTRSEASAALASAQAVLGEITTDEADVGVALFSALKKSGVGDAATVLHGWVQP